MAEDRRNWESAAAGRLKPSCVSRSSHFRVREILWTDRPPAAAPWQYRRAGKYSRRGPGRSATALHHCSPVRGSGDQPVLTSRILRLRGKGPGSSLPGPKVVPPAPRPGLEELLGRLTLLGSLQRSGFIVSPTAVLVGVLGRWRQRTV